ncbi:MAG: FAD-dependent oxidoreductase [Roseburia sp.]|jgi:NADPH-dependent 2,4-dienoyl-CoA reductase/sulfur reductase-like enzyme/CxxC motif-containing protein|nr:FAD-dependent oxidoreductase [Roseburia sp.]
MKKCDVLIIGGGPGGLAAGCAAKKSGADTVIVLERDKCAGGILNQCIHNGFGLIRYHAELTGPEYADRAKGEAEDAGVEILTSRHVSGIKSDENGRYIVSAYTPDGIEAYQAKTIILATGCRERTRGNISIPGDRPAGVFTAGVAQNLVNVRNVMIGKRVVILGSGDIGLIMARRLTLEGANVPAIAEIMPEPAGLARNVSQCVYEFEIPLYVKTTVSKIIGKKRLEAVELSDVDEDGAVIPGTARRIECDALVLSVGLIPENEVALTAGVKLLPDHAVDTDSHLQTSVPGIFSCGNSRHVMDLADYVSEQGEMAGRNAVHFIKDEAMETWDEEKSNCMKKGFPEEETVTCTICPNGCQVKWDEAISAYSGNRCPRGIPFAEQERIKPMRTVTTTVKTAAGEKILLPVRSAAAVDRNRVRAVVEKLKDVRAEKSLNTGDEVHRMKLDGNDVSIIATARL